MDNARVVGAYMVKKLRKHDRKLDPAHTPEQDRHHAEGPTRGMGLLIYTNTHARNVQGAMGRLMPYLSFTKTDVDQMFGKNQMSRW